MHSIDIYQISHKNISGMLWTQPMQLIHIWIFFDNKIEYVAIESHRSIYFHSSAKN